MYSFIQSILRKAVHQISTLAFAIYEPYAEKGFKQLQGSSSPVQMSCGRQKYCCMVDCGDMTSDEIFCSFAGMSIVACCRFVVPWSPRSGTRLVGGDMALGAALCVVSSVM